MKYIAITEVDAITKVPCTVEPQRTGPSIPAIKGLQLDWADKSTWPVELAQDGSYLRAPKYYGTCDDDADTNIAGVLQVLTEAEYASARIFEYQARKPFPSWIGNEKAMTWKAPTPMPNDEKFYSWNEEQLVWLETL
jgi:hypothetical protein